MKVAEKKELLGLNSIAKSSLSEFTHKLKAASKAMKNNLSHKVSGLGNELGNMGDKVSELGNTLGKMGKTATNFVEVELINRMHEINNPILAGKRERERKGITTSQVDTDSASKKKKNNDKSKIKSQIKKKGGSSEKFTDSDDALGNLTDDEL